MNCNKNAIKNISENAIYDFFKRCSSWSTIEIYCLLGTRMAQIFSPIPFIADLSFTLKLFFLFNSSSGCFWTIRRVSFLCVEFNSELRPFFAHEETSQWDLSQNGRPNINILFLGMFSIPREPFRLFRHRVYGILIQWVTKKVFYW